MKSPFLFPHQFRFLYRKNNFQIFLSLFRLLPTPIKYPSSRTCTLHTGLTLVCSAQVRSSYVTSPHILDRPRRAGREPSNPRTPNPRVQSSNDPRPPHGIFRTPISFAYWHFVIFSLCTRSSPTFFSIPEEPPGMFFDITYIGRGTFRIPTNLYSVFLWCTLYGRRSIHPFFVNSRNATRTVGRVRLQNFSRLRIVK